MKLNSHKRKIETKYIILIFILSIGIMIGFLSLVIKDNRSLSFGEKGFKDIGLVAQNILYAPFRFVTGKIDNYREMKRIYLKYKDVDEVDSKGTLLEEENKELKRSIAELKETLQLNTIVTDYEKVNATVITRNVGNWYDNLTIDKGSRSGIKANMIVITNKGLIGKVIKTTFYTSDVKLITTPDLNNKISVGIADETSITYGLLSGYDKSNKLLMITDVVDDKPLKAGDKVITSGLSEVFPKGIIIGTVAKVEEDEFGISKIIKVNPAVDFNDLTYVTILKGSVKQ